MGFEREKDNAEIEKPEEIYNLLFEDSPVGVIISDSKGIVVDCNKVVEKLGNFTKGELIGKSFTKFLTLQPDLIELFMDRMKRTYQGESPEPIEFPVKFKGENLIWLKLNASTIKSGQKTLILSVIEDITQRKITEQKLKESEEKYRDTLELLPDVVYEMNKDFELIYLNQAGLDKFKYSREDLKNGLSVFDMISSKSLGTAIANIKEFLNGKDISATDYLLKRKDGSEFWGSVHSRVIQKDGKILGMEGIITDVTKDKQFREILKESEEKFRNIAEQSLMGIAIIQDNLVKYVNERFASILGYAVDEVMEFPRGTHRKLIHPEDIDFVIEQARKKQRGDQDAITHYSYRLLKKAGETVWIDNFSTTINYGGRNADLVMVIDITEHKKADRELKESEEKFREISEQLLMGICILQDDKIKYVNKKFANIIGYTVEEMMNWDPSEYIKTVYPEDRKKAIEQARKKQRGEKDIMINYQTRAIKKTGETIWIDNYSKTINYGGTYADLVMIKDITDQKMAEQKLRESEEKYRLITENANDMISILNQKMVFEYINEKSHYKTLGFLGKELIGKNPIDFVHPDDVEFVVKAFNVGLDSGEGEAEYRFRHKDGSYVWLGSNGRTFVDKNGVTKALIISRDISLRKILDDARRTYTENLEKEVEKRAIDLIDEKKKIETIINTISDGVLVLDIQGKLVLVNEILKKYYYQIYEREIPVDFSASFNPDNIFDDTIKKLFLSKTPENVTFEPKDGLFLQCVSIGIGGLNSDDSKIGSIIEVRDVTPFIEFDNMRRQFVTTVTHELRTPISALLQSIENLEDYQHQMSEETQEQLMNTISENTKLLAELVEDLLVISRIEEKKIALKWERFKPKNILKEILDQLEPLRISKSIKVEIEVDDEVELFGDIKRIGQIFRIFIDNALKYSKTGAILNIKAIDHYKGDYNFRDIDGVLMIFSDTGIGIRKKDIPQLFKRFFRSKDVRNVPGTGLGLSIAKEFIQLHVGEVNVESKFGKGSKFYVFLPRLEEPP